MNQSEKSTETVATIIDKHYESARHLDDSDPVALLISDVLYYCQTHNIPFESVVEAGKTRFLHRA